MLEGRLANPSLTTTPSEQLKLEDAKSEKSEQEKL